MERRVQFRGIPITNIIGYVLFSWMKVEIVWEYIINEAEKKEIERNLYLKRTISSEKINKLEYY